MFKTLTTLIIGANARSEDTVRDAFAIPLIDQKIREAETSLRAGKATLATLIQRQRAEKTQRDGLRSRIADLTTRATAALAADNDAMALQAADAIAQMENELTLRDTTCARLDHKTLRLRHSIEQGHRQIIDLKQGAIQARAVRREQDIQIKLGAVSQSSATDEAQDLIDRVLNRDDPFEHGQILTELNNDLSHDTLTTRMSDAGFGAPTRATAQTVMTRLKSTNAQ